MGRKSVPIRITIFYPKGEEEKKKLAEAAATVHAEMVSRYIQKSNCPYDQKITIFNAVNETK